jgi:hypothetical protein
MSIGEKAHDKAFDQILLADDHLVDLGKKWGDKPAGLLHGGVDG